MKIPEEAHQFAMDCHQNQFRLGRLREPFVQHPIRVARLLQTFDLTEEDLIVAALLHDVLEDTSCTFEQLAERFGPNVAGTVHEVTDDKHLLKSLRKQYQVERAPYLSLPARLIRLADKIDNVSTLTVDPPTSWNHIRCREYIAWSRRVVHRLQGTHRGLETLFAARADEAWSFYTGAQPA